MHQITPDWYRVDCYIPDELDEQSALHHIYSHAEHATSYKQARTKAEAWVEHGFSEPLIQPRLFN